MLQGLTSVNQASSSSSWTLLFFVWSLNVKHKSTTSHFVILISHNLVGIVA